MTRRPNAAGIGSDAVHTNDDPLQSSHATHASGVRPPLSSGPESCQVVSDQPKPTAAGGLTLRGFSPNQRIKSGVNVTKHCRQHRFGCIHALIDTNDTAANGQRKALGPGGLL